MVYKRRWTGALLETLFESPHDFHSGGEAERSTVSLGCPLGGARKLEHRFAMKRAKVQSSFTLHDCDLSHEAEGSGGFFAVLSAGVPVTALKLTQKRFATQSFSRGRFIYLQFVEGPKVVPAVLNVLIYATL